MKTTETMMLKARLYAALIKKEREHLTDNETQLVELLSEDCEVESLLEDEKLDLLELAIKRKEKK